jgi:diaminohydroxyphosphoribosylaminopyrimidine deaminase / 5-amino-6-(5-phosphoribosylamino)uracil reductase
MGLHDFIMDQALKIAFRQALDKAKLFAGATSPNPPVGAAALDASGKILSVQAHEMAGAAHAEAKVIEDCRTRQLASQIHTLVVTLEPCNHHGRTPPCTDMILKHSIHKVVFGASDPNPRVQGGGAQRLKKEGLEVHSVEDEELKIDCADLIRPFTHWSKTDLPWITVKTALSRSGSMIPPKNHKTFTSVESLRFAHELRKRADAILTGSGTILADNPEFTVRYILDHPGKIRWLVILDRRRRVSNNFIESATQRGFQVVRQDNLQTAIEWLGKQGVLELLVEAGPTLTQAVLASGLWNQHVVITQGDPDQIQVRLNQA